MYCTLAVDVSSPVLQDILTTTLFNESTGPFNVPAAITPALALEASDVVAVDKVNKGAPLAPVCLYSAEDVDCASSGSNVDVYGALILLGKSYQSEL